MNEKEVLIALAEKSWVIEIEEGRVITNMMQLSHHDIPTSFSYFKQGSTLYYLYSIEE
jgi:hypothetical protein